MIECKNDLKRYLKMDKYALNIEQKRPSFIGDEIWKFEIILRKHEYYTNCSKNIFQKIMKKYYGLRHHYMGLRLGFEIPCNVFGGGVRINHYGLIIVNPKAKIGDWCDIHQGAHIGQNVEGEVPTLGDNVYIGPGAKIFGNVVLGNNMMIGANAVVTKSFPEGYCKIAGVPAKIISNDANPLARKLD